MSYIGYFKSAIENYFNTKNKTLKVKKEEKKLINQFRISESYSKFEDLKEYKIMKAQIKKYMMRFIIINNERSKL